MLNPPETIEPDDVLPTSERATVRLSQMIVAIVQIAGVTLVVCLLFVLFPGE